MLTLSVPTHSLITILFFKKAGATQKQTNVKNNEGGNYKKWLPWLLLFIFLLICAAIYLYRKYYSTPPATIHGVEVSFSASKNLPVVTATSLSEKEGQAIQIIEKIQKTGNFNPTDEELLLLMEVARETNNRELRDLILSIIGPSVAMLAEMFANHQLEIQDEFSVEVVLFWLIELQGILTEVGSDFFMENGEIIHEMAEGGNALAEQVENLMAETINLFQSMYKPGFSQAASRALEDMTRLVLQVGNHIEVAATEAQQVMERLRRLIEEERTSNQN